MSSGVMIKQDPENEVQVNQVLDNNNFDIKKSGKYKITEEKYEILQVNADPNGQTQFFAKNEKGLEEDYRFETNVGLREGHQVTLIFVSRKRDDFAQVVGIINHTTGRFAYRDNVEYQYFPTHWTEALSGMGMNLMDQCNHMMERNRGLVGGIFILCMLPILLGIMALGIGLALLAALIYGSVAKKRKAFSARVKNYSNFI